MKNLSEIRGRSGSTSKDKQMNMLLDAIVNVTSYGDPDYYDDDMRKIKKIVEQIRKLIK